MANKSIFKSNKTRNSVVVEAADCVNNAGGVAYKQTDKHALAQYCLTGTISNTFYSNAEAQLDEILKLSKKVPTEFIAKLAVYAREHGYMKDTPAVLCAILAVRDVELLKKVFPLVMDNGKMVRNFVQIIRSGKVGRKSFGSSLKKMIQKWITSRHENQLFRDSVGNDPSLCDVIKMVRPRPADKVRENLYAYITGHLSFSMKNDKLTIAKTIPCKGEVKTVKVSSKDIPKIICEYETYKLTKNGEVPDVPFQMLTALDLGKKEWTSIADNAKWTMTRMNLNTFNRHGVFEDRKMIAKIASRLSSKEEIQKAKIFPYQLFAAYMNTEDVPHEIKEALQDAMEIAIDNIPSIDCQVYIACDTSGSMSSNITGNRGSASSKIRCIDVAALISSAILRKNPSAKILPFDTTVHKCNFNPRDSVMTNARTLAKFGGGGTSCAAPIATLNASNAKGDLVIMISDNESWASFNKQNYYGDSGTEMSSAWKQFKLRNPNAKLICLDLVPNNHSQAKNSEDVLNIGGFSDIIFDIFASFIKGDLFNEAFTAVIESVSLDSKNVRKALSSEKIEVEKAKK